MFFFRPGLMQPQAVQASWLNGRRLFVLRTDKLHEVVSGNKWFKLKYYLQTAQAQGFTSLATFGGCYSNHIVATAYAARAAGFKSLGIIRGEPSSQQTSHTLQAALSYGMQLQFVSREDYRDKESIQRAHPGYYWIGEGGYGRLGAKGAGEILSMVPGFEQYDHIVLAAGTGTTMAGIISVAQKQQHVTGISVMKNNFAILNDVEKLLPPQAMEKKYTLLHDFHFGGYAKKKEELVKFMNEFYAETQVPTDFVYTAKAMYALRALCLQNVIETSASVLFIHTGGLQGNRSLPPGTLCYD